MSDTVTLPSPLPAGTLPEWLHLVPNGTFKGVDGRGPYKLADPAKVIAASMAAGKLPLDENHSTDLAGPAGQPSPARGWIVEMQMREDGLWGRIDWNDSGKQLMADRAYRGISPVFTADKGGNVVAVLRASLTNTPNLADLKTLHSQHESRLELDIAQLRSALGLPADADAAAILARAADQRLAVTRHAADLARLSAAAGAADTSSADALVTHLQARQAAASSVEKMAATVTTLQAELQTLRAAGAREAAVRFIDGAIKDGKPIAPLRDHLVERHMADAAAVEKEVGLLPVINAGGMTFPRKQSEGGEDELTQEEMSVCKQMRLDPKKFAAQKRADMLKGAR